MAEADVLALARSLKSVWTIEILICLFRPPRRPWSEGELVRELRASVSVVAAGLDVLARAGLVVETDSHFKFGGANAAIEQVAADLAETYARRPLTITAAIFDSKQAIQQFSDAFRIQKDV